MAVLSVIFVFLFATTATSNPLDPLDKTVEAALRKSGSPGIAIGTLFEGKTEIAVAGVRRSGSKPLIQPTDKWHLGSITKSMTSTLIARLSDKGVLSFDDTIGGVLGKQIPDLNAAYQSVTYRQLVSHRSGLPRDLDFGFFYLVLQGKLEERDVKEDRMIFSRTALRRKPNYKPGTKFLYSNVGYVVAATMMEITTGKSWETLMQEEVFIPLKMKSAGFGAPGAGGKITQPYGHVLLPWGEYYPVDPSKMSDIIPAGGPAVSVHANVGDMLRYLEAHREEDRSYLTKSSWKDLHTPPKGSSYAAGWVVHNNSILSHTGSNGAWYAFVAFSKKDKSALVICSNYYRFKTFLLTRRIEKVFLTIRSTFFGESS